MKPESLLRPAWPLLFALALISTPAAAQNSFDLDILGQGEIMLNLNASESTEVEQDTLHASLYYSAQGRDRVALQNEVNEAMAEALALLEDGGVDYATQQYYVHIVRPERPTRGDPSNPMWRAQQGLQLTSEDSAALLELVAELQGMGLTMSSLNYSLSPQRYEEVSDSLMEAVLDKLRARAEAAAAALGKSGAELVEVTLNSSNNQFRGRSTMALSADAEMAPPVAEPGETTVSLNVSARAILSP